MIVSSRRALWHPTSKTDSEHGHDWDDEELDDDGDFFLVERGPVSTVRKALRTGFGHDPSTLQWVAVKTSTTNRRFAKQPHDVVKEARMLSKLSHANVVPLFDYTDDPSSWSMHLWMPFIPLSFDRILDSPSFSPYSPPSLPAHPSLPNSYRHPQPFLTTRFLILAKSIAFQILSATAYLHDPAQSIAHRDIKPRNILLTEDGCAKLIDFGISWKNDETEDQQQHDLWPERSEEMCTAVSTGPYRAPELLFGPKSYNAFAADLWSLGTTLSELFTSLELVLSSSSSSSPLPHSDTESETTTEFNEHFVIPKTIISNSTRALSPDTECKWIRTSLFDGTRGELGLIWSIFKTMGTPNEQTWAGFKGLASSRSVTFKEVHGVPLDTRLPNLPPSPLTTPSSTLSQPWPLSPSQTQPQPQPENQLRIHALDLISKLLVYPPENRLRAQEALSHPFLTFAGVPLLLPPHYSLQAEQEHVKNQVAAEWEGRSLGDLIEQVLELNVGDTEGGN
ncbi:hypothetical protein AX15_001362 [Amanita polypyramis BW_CC]|nr:hypothetical protein AX15_001362 [Amanita polypyramis BW_CC]